MFHLSMVNNEASGIAGVSTDSVKQTIHQLRIESEACGRQASACKQLDQSEKHAVSIIEGKKQDIYRASVFALLTNFTLMTLGGMCAGYATASSLRRVEPGSDEAEEALMREKSRPVILTLLNSLVLLSSFAVINIVVVSVFLYPNSVSDYLAAFKLFLAAATVAACALVCAGLFYSKAPVGRYCMIVVASSILLVAVLYCFGLISFFGANKGVGMTIDWPMSGFLWGGPGLYLVLKIALSIYKSKSKVSDKQGTQLPKRITCTPHDTLELYVNGKTYRVCECASRKSATGLTG